MFNHQGTNCIIVDVIQAFFFVWTQNYKLSSTSTESKVSQLDYEHDKLNMRTKATSKLFLFSFLFFFSFFFSFSLFLLTKNLTWDNLEKKKENKSRSRD